MSLAVRPAIRAAITSCYATQRLWNRPNIAGSSVASMYAIVVESADQLSWQQVPDVAPSRGEVLVKVSAAGVNRADLLQAAGLYPPPPGASELLGMEVSGVIEAVGDDVAGWAAGARSLRFAGRRRLRRIRGRSRRPASAASRWPRPAGLGRRAGGGLHGLVEPGDDGSSERGSTAADARRRQRRGQPRHSGRPRTGRPGRRHRGIGGQAGIVPRTGCRDLDQLSRRGLRRARAGGDRRRGRRRDLRHHGRLVPGPQSRRACR